MTTPAETPGTSTPAADAAVAALRAAGLRVTAPRRAVLAWLVEHPHSTADAVGTGVRAELGTISTQTVYDVLAACVDAGLVRRIEPAGHPARFERRVADNHHHIVCRQCGATADVDCTVGAAPCLTPSDAHGFAVDEAEVVFWGLCPDCQGPDCQSPDCQDPEAPDRQAPNRQGPKYQGLGAPDRQEPNRQGPTDQEPNRQAAEQTKRVRESAQARP